MSSTVSFVLLIVVCGCLFSLGFFFFFFVAFIWFSMLGVPLSERLCFDPMMDCADQVFVSMGCTLAMWVGLLGVRLIPGLGGCLVLYVFCL